LRAVWGVVIAAAIVAAPRAQSEPSLDQLLARAADYVRGLEVQMAMVIGDEVYHQRAMGSRSSVDRTIHAEMLFWWLDEDHVWLSVRNVLKVDKTPVPDSRDRLERAFAAPAQMAAGEQVVISRSDRLRSLQEESARFDIGVVHRTTSNPTEVLQYLLAENQAQFAFTRAGEHRVNGTRAWKIAFSEQRRPTVLRFGALDVPTSGAVWVRADDGVVVRTERTVSPPRFKATISVDFQRDSKLELWVPKRMEEVYGNAVRCSSDDTNYRHFETSGRILPEQ